MNSSVDDSINIDAIINSSAKAELEKVGDRDGVYYELEKAKAELEKIAIEKDILKEELQNRKQDRALRRQYADMIFNYLLGYSVFCGFVIVSQATVPTKFSLPEPALVALVGSTAVAVVGLVGFVVKGLFKPPSDK